MHPVKDSPRSLVRVGYDGRVHKTFRGPKAKQRFTNEVRVLRHLEKAGCDFVPRVLEADEQRLYLVTSNCGKPVDQLNGDKQRNLFDRLRGYGVCHGDEELRNITYRISDQRFCVIDFELARIDGDPPATGDSEDEQKRERELRRLPESRPRRQH
jgi:tRNA A-37 threonylcarbamoyl transferase component Bud32